MNILHLSDIHFGRNYPEYGLKDNFAKHDEIIDGIIEKIKELPDDLKPEHIVVTGDIAWHATSKEFTEAYAFFDKLLNACNLSGNNISFCVGNHDVDIRYSCIDEILNDYDIAKIDEYYKYENNNIFEPSIYAYDTFCKYLGVIPYSYPIGNKRNYSYSVGYKDVVFSDGKKIRLIGLNTCLLYMNKGISEDKMWMGQEQIKTLMEYKILPADDEINYTIVLYHHSDRFLHPNETSSYDGRRATLPLVQSYADLLLCGHTESGENIKMNRQAGGGTIISSGASYYSDDHKNSFSMLYLNEIKKGIAFIPYVYENGQWQDLDYSMEPLKLRKGLMMPPQNTKIENTVLLVEGDGESYKIKNSIYEVEFDGEKYHSSNRADVMNYFGFKGTWDENGIGEFDIFPSSRWYDYLPAIETYRKFADFLEKHKNDETMHYCFLDKDGKVLYEEKGSLSFRYISCEEEVYDKLKKIADYYHVYLHVPDKLTKKEEKNASILIDLAKTNITKAFKAPAKVEMDVDLKVLEEIYAKSETGTIFIRSKITYDIALLGANINLRDVTVIAGPYLIDREDLKKKIDSFCEGDVRKVQLDAKEDMNAKLVKGIGQGYMDYTVEVPDLYVEVEE